MPERGRKLYFNCIDAVPYLLLPGRLGFKTESAFSLIARKSKKASDGFPEGFVSLNLGDYDGDILF